MIYIPVDKPTSCADCQFYIHDFDHCTVLNRKLSPSEYIQRSACIILDIELECRYFDPEHQFCMNIGKAVGR